MFQVLVLASREAQGAVAITSQILVFNSAREAEQAIERIRCHRETIGCAHQVEAIGLY
jgi:hypothetical protein